MTSIETPAPSDRPDSPETSAPRSIVRRYLTAMPFLAGVDDALLDALTDRLHWLSVPGGWTLISEGEQADGLFFVVTGRLLVSVASSSGSSVPIIEIGAGETVGEMALILGKFRTATVAAQSDSELLFLPRRDFDSLIEAYPRAMLRVTGMLVHRLERMTHGDTGKSMRILAVLPLGPDVPVEEIARKMVDELSVGGVKTAIVTSVAGAQPIDWFRRVESRHEIVIYCADPTLTPWTRRCLRQADRVILLGASTVDRRAETAIRAAIDGQRKHAFDLIGLVNADLDAIAAQLGAIPNLKIDLTFRVRQHRRYDIARAARLAAGRAVGLVLSGGGARGFAHLGVIRALDEAGIPLDHLGGCSMGAIIAGGVALDWSVEEQEDRMKRAFVVDNPVNDYTIPRLALTKGKKVTRRLQEHFAETTIETLWRPYFCVSSNLTTGRVVVHRRGLLWQALRASASIPGILPPVIENGEVLVDGGVLNNLPVDVMSADHRGRVIGVDVTADRALNLIGGDDARGPGIVSILMRAGTVSSEAQVQMSRARADLLLTPPLREIDMLNWRQFERAIEIGYRYTIDALEQRGKFLV